MTYDEPERVMQFIIERQESADEQQAISIEQLAQTDAILNVLA